MKKYCAFLRGANVKGTNMKMAEVCKVFSDAGLQNVSSVLASGNILFQSDENDAVLKNILQKSMSDQFSYDAFLFIKNEKEIKDIFKNNPFSASENYHHYVFLGNEKIEGTLMEEFEKASKEDGEQGKIVSGIFYWQVPKGQTLDSSFGKILGKKSLKDKMTSRNVNTFEKIIKKTIMKKLLQSFLMIYSLQFFAQIKVPSDFDFSTSFYEAENRYIVFSPKTEDTEFSVGVPYFDSEGGYSYKYLGSLKDNNGKLMFIPTDNSLIARWQNMDLKVAVLSDERIKEFKLANPPEFLKFYKSNKPEKDFLVDKLSFMNGAGFSKLALPKLEQLRIANYQSEKFYFELAFAYNALEQNAKAEELVEEAEKNNFHSELLIKEKHYALLKQEKLIAASEYLQENVGNFKTKNFKSESIVNQIVYFSNHQDLKNAEKWIQIYRKEIGEDQYKSHVDNIEKNLKGPKKQAAK